ncbi:MAG: hypothetical protein KatS3mg009_2440 [Acidimicrobiia bacterium]|nr:MAG: hypothetical protein KatS3mg009_2440 [Acidimicrobiia bacterium]
MNEGEIVDEAAVTEAIVRLREEVDVRRVDVRLGIASPRVIVRQVEMPLMTPDELASALEFQAGELIPIPVDEAVIDFAILGTEADDDGQEIMKVLLAAAQRASVSRLVAAVEAAGLPVAAVDLSPLALVRALARPLTDEHVGAEGIVSFGGGVTAIAVHEAGVPRFVRVLGTAGRELTEAIAAELSIPPESAEAVKRQLVTGAGDELVERARAAIERPLALLLDEVRSSVDYYRNQPGAARLMRVVVTGGGSQLPGLPERLATLVGVPVEVAHPRDTLRIGDIRFPESEYPRLDPYLPAAVGLALGGAGVGTVVDLLPRQSRSRAQESRSRVLAGAAIGAAALLGVLAVPTVVARQQVDDKRGDLAAVERETQALQREIADLASAQQLQAQISALEAGLGGLLATDVSWVGLMEDVARTMPDGVWLTSFQGQVTLAAPAAPSSSRSAAGEDADEDGGSTRRAATAAVTPAFSGTVSFEGGALDYPSVAEWLERLGDPEAFPAFDGLWVSNASQAETDGRTTVEFSSSGSLTEAARSDRIEQFGEQEER